MFKMPSIYRPATWSNTTAVDRESSVVGVGLRLETGELLRVRLSLLGAEELRDSLAFSLSLNEASASHQGPQDSPPSSVCPMGNVRLHT